MSAILPEPRVTPPPAVAARGPLLLQGIRWQTFQSLSEDIGERRLRLTYDHGRMELMAPQFHHEWFKKLLGQLVAVLAEELNRPFVAAGSTTLQREDLQYGVEPDECFYFQQAAGLSGRERIDLPGSPPPDLAIEIDVTSSSINRQTIYAALGVPELWRYDGEDLELMLLSDTGYAPAASSRVFPELKADALNDFIRTMPHTNDLEVIRQFRQWVRTNCLAAKQ